jgi:putative colanic acid biosynthesis acetyltransferase WcaF
MTDLNQTDLSIYQHVALNCHHSWFKRVLWFYVNAIFFKTSLLPFSEVKVRLLRLFAARIGRSVVIKPCVNIKYPWLLQIGDHSWIGENVWIDNVDCVSIGNHVCVSQGALLLTGSHNYKDPAFGLMTGNILIADGVWIGAGAIINQGITAHSHAVLNAGAVATKDLEAWSVYQGNPAGKIRDRVFQRKPSGQQIIQAHV